MKIYQIVRRKVLLVSFLEQVMLDSFYFFMSATWCHYFHVWVTNFGRFQWNLGKEMHSYSLVSIQVLFQIPKVFMVVARWLKVKNGQQQSGFMWITLTRHWDLVIVAQMQMKIVKDGQPWANAPKIQTIWWELMSFQDPVERAAKLASTSTWCFPLTIVFNILVLFTFSFFQFNFLCFEPELTFSHSFYLLNVIGPIYKCVQCL